MAAAETIPSGARRRHDVVVIGGGNGGLSIAGRLRRNGVKDVAVIEPRASHIYKPLQSHVAGGRVRASRLVRAQGRVTPRGVRWIRDMVVAVDAETNEIRLAGGGVVEFTQLVLSAGIAQDWTALPGLEEAMRTPAGASNYELPLAEKASRLLRGVTSGTVVFSQPPGPASCAGAIQKPMYLACDYWRATGVLDTIRVVMLVPGPTVFGIPEIDAELERKIREYGIELRTGAAAASVDPASRRLTTTAGDTIDYDVLIAEPPQSAPDWIARNDLAGPESGGFVDVDPRTLRHRRLPQIWAIGDVAATTNSKSGGALRKQTAVAAQNILDARRSRIPSARYDGYGVCPFTVSRHTVVFAEFDDRGRLAPTVPFWRSMYRESRLAWVFDRHILPWVYWHMILQGRA